MHPAIDVELPPAYPSGLRQEDSEPTMQPVQRSKMPSNYNSFLMAIDKAGANVTRLSSVLGNVSSVSSSASAGTIYANQFYNLSVYLASKDIPVIQYKSLPKVHLIRIPKASSSSMSAVARRAVGCSPPGPCCHFPGVPVGSCASKGLFKCQEDKKVIGCTDHFPSLRYLFEPRVPSISMMRNPYTRSLSGFFYPGIHHNSDCAKDIDTCFVEYTQNLKWKNIAVKMLTGDHAYAPVKTCANNDTCIHSAQQAVENLRYFAFMGVAEMWELSLLVYHRKFPTIAPDLSEFKMSTEENSVTKGNRVNMKEGYAEFKRNALDKHRDPLYIQNSLDTILYRAVIDRLCEELHSYAVWQYPLVREYWALYSPVKTLKCP
eukprot:gene12330-14273_t